MKRISLLLLGFLAFGSKMVILGQTANQEKAREKPELTFRQAPYVPQKRPFLWLHLSQDPYFTPCKSRSGLVRLAQKPGLFEDLTKKIPGQEGLSPVQANYIIEQLKKADNPESKIYDTIIPPETPLVRMLFGKGRIEPMVINKVGEVKAVGIDIPAELGYAEIRIPYTCCNIAQKLAYSFRIDSVRQEESKPVEKTVYIEKPVYRTIEKPVYVEKPVYIPVEKPVYIETKETESRCGKKCKIILGIIGGAGGGTGVYFLAREKKPSPASAPVPYKPIGGGGWID